MSAEGTELEKTDVTSVPVHELEALRLRLTQLTHSLNGLQGQIQHAHLPSWPALHGQFNVILTQLTSLSATLSTHSEVLSKTVTYPLPNFPTVTQQGLLTTLLRKKNLPEVEEWIKEGEEMAKDIDLSKDDEFCRWANKMVEEFRDEHQWSGFLTTKELEEGKQDDGIGIKKSESDGGWSIDEVLKYMSTGEIKGQNDSIVIDQ